MIPAAASINGSGRALPIVLGGDPPHDAEAADEVYARDLQPVVRKVGEVLPELRIFVPREVKLANLRGRRLDRGSNEGHAGGAERIARNVRLRNEKAGPRILAQILGVHRHAADEKHGAAAFVSRVRHHRAKRESRELARMRGQAADATERGECTCALRERRFGDFGTGGAGAGVLHESMVAETVERNSRSRYTQSQPDERKSPPC